MNVKRGLIRLWGVFSILWVGLFLAFGAPDWYRAADHWLNEARIAAQAVRVKETKQDNLQPSDVRAPSGFPCRAASQKCFDVTAPNGSRYVVRARDTDTEESVANLVRRNPEKFNEPPQDPKATGWGNDPFFVDLTGQWLVVGESVDLGLAPLFAVVAFAVPLAVLALGYALGWVTMGFKP